MATAILDTPKPVSAVWRITKAKVQDGQMKWVATTTRFSRDVQKDKVTRSFYEDAIRRFKSGTVPPPFFSVAHYGVQKTCECGAEFKSLSDYICSICKAERLIAGVTTDIWIDGEQPKAEGYFYPTTLGKAIFAAAQADIQKSVPVDERIRISMGFYPDPRLGTAYHDEGRDFVAGWIEHFASTRVPVVPETDLAVMEKSMKAIKTKFEDAESQLPTELAERLAKSETLQRTLKSGTGPQLVIKAKDRQCPQCGTEVPTDSVDCPECGKMMGMMDKSAVVLPDELAEKADAVGDVQRGAPVAHEVKPTDTDPVEKPDDKLSSNDSDLKDEKPGDDTDELAEGDADIVTPAKSAVVKHMPDSVCPECGAADVDQTHVGRGTHKCEKCGYEYMPTEMKSMRRDVGSQDNYDADDEEDTEMTDEEHDKKGRRVEAEPMMAMGKSLVDDDLMAEAYEALQTVEKAMVTPGGNKSELLARAANLVSAIRDYAHVLADQPGQEAAEAVQMGNEVAAPAVTTGQQIGGNLPPVPEKEVKERPHIDEATEEATESPEDDAAETPADEAEEGRLHFVKQPSSGEVDAAMKPPAPVKPAKPKGKPVPAVKSHPGEVFMQRWSDGLTNVIVDPSLSRLKKRELVQKALNEFGSSVVKLINDTTPTAPEDLEDVVKSAVATALEQANERYQKDLAALTATVKTLTGKVVDGEVKAIAARRPLRRSLSAEDLPTVSKSQPNGLEALAGDQLVKKGFSAGEVAKASSVPTNPLYRY